MNIICGDAATVLETIDAGIIQTCVTSCPYYGQRDYQIDGQIGLETTPDDYIASLLRVFDQVHRVLRDDGTFWLNIGDGYWGDTPPRASGRDAFAQTWDRTQTRSRGGTRRSAARWENLKSKDLIGMPWRIASALQTAGWYVRSEIVWVKTDATREPARDRPSLDHESVLFCSKSRHYQHNQHEDVRSSVWMFPARSNERSRFQHPASFPVELPRRCIKASTTCETDIVLDPFCGSGTSGVAAKRLRRQFIGIDLRDDWCQQATERIAIDATLFDC